MRIRSSLLSAPASAVVAAVAVSITSWPLAVSALPQEVPDCEPPRIRGEVRENFGLNAPLLGGVWVHAEGSNEMTTHDGRFCLSFPNASAGDEIKLEIAKDGFVVVNDVQLTLNIPSSRTGKLTPDRTIYLSAPHERDRWAREFYRLKSVEAIEAAYEKRFRATTAAEHARLRDERDQALAAAKEAADELARLESGEGSRHYRQAMRFLLDGRIDDALESLSEDTLVARR